MNRCKRYFLIALDVRKLEDNPKETNLASYNICTCSIVYQFALFYTSRSMVIDEISNHSLI